MEKDELLQHEESAIKTHLKLALGRISEQQTQISTLEQLIQNILEKFDKIENQRVSLPIFNDVFTWKFTIEEIKNSDKSKTFYTSEYHNMKVNLKTNTRETGEKYIEVYFKSIKGSFDDTIKWPINARISFSIWDGKNCLNKHELETKDYVEYFIHSPLQDDGSSIGWAEFLSCDTIFTSDYLTLNVVIEYL